MNFNDILDQWEKQKLIDQKRKLDAAARPGPGKKANAGDRGERTEAQSDPETAARAEAAAAAKAALTRQKTGAALDSWISAHGIVDKDSLLEQEEGESGDRGSGHREKLEQKPQARLDLHGLTAAEAETSLRRFLAESARHGLVKVLIVHGKGNHSVEGPVLAGLVRRIVESSPEAGSHGPAHRTMGGRGATWVCLKKTGYFSR